MLGFIGVVALTTAPVDVPARTVSGTDLPAVGETMTLSLYRNPETRETVVDFFTNLTKSAEVTQAILTACEENNLSPLIAFSLAKKESSFQPHVVGRNLGSQDRGLFQLNSISYPDLPVSAAMNPHINARLGVSHLRESILQAGSIEKGLAAYNAGYSRVRRNLIPASTRLYVSSILGYIDGMERLFIENILLDNRIASGQKVPKKPGVLASHAQ